MRARSHLVVFRRPSVRNASLLRQARAPEGARVFRRFGVAAVDLEASQVAWMRAQPDVVDVVVNDRRRLPPVVAGPGDGAWGFAATRADRWAGPRGDGIKVAVLGTGVDAGHPWFASQRLAGERCASYVPGAGPEDGHGFGTHACGIIGGSGGAGPRLRADEREGARRRR